jgi:hypothetical protein
MSLRAFVGTRGLLGLALGRVPGAGPPRLNVLGFTEAAPGRAGPPAAARPYYGGPLGGPNPTKRPNLRQVVLPVQRVAKMALEAPEFGDLCQVDQGSAHAWLRMKVEQEACPMSHLFFKAQRAPPWSSAVHKTRQLVRSGGPHTRAASRLRRLAGAREGGGKVW